MKGPQTLDCTINECKGWQDNHGPYETNLIGDVEKACSKKIKDMSLSDLQALLQCGIAPEITVPLALTELRENPTLYARHYEGDMFETLLKIDAQFWEQNKTEWLRMNNLLTDFEATYESIRDAAVNFRGATKEA